MTDRMIEALEEFIAAANINRNGFIDRWSTARLEVAYKKAVIAIASAKTGAQLREALTEHPVEMRGVA